MPLSAKLQITSAGEEPLAFESKALKAPGKVTRGEKVSDSSPGVLLLLVFLCCGALNLLPFFLPALESAVFALELTLDVLEITKSSPPPSVKP